MMTDTNPQPGFDGPVLGSQRLFRQLLTAFSNPGSIQKLDDSLYRDPVNNASHAICLMLADYETTLWIEDAEAENENLVNFYKFHCGTPLVTEPSEASFALVLTPGKLPYLGNFNQGEASFPDRSTTLIVQVNSLVTDSGWRLRGPGIKGDARLQVEGLPKRFLSDWWENHALFPMGVDLILTCGASFAALSRTTIIE